MPRKTRRQLVGMQEDLERKERERALEALCHEMRRLGRLRTELMAWPASQEADRSV